jgi:molecular chaperone DnaK
MNEFKDQLDEPSRDKVNNLMTELRQLAVKGQAGEADITAEIIKAKIDETQQASLGLFQKVYEKRAAENSNNSTSGSGESGSSESGSGSSSTEGSSSSGSEGEKKN